MDLLRSLNPRQREAVTHTEGPLLVLAGAGSGKTRVLAHRVAHILSKRAAGPGQILAVTFTNKAAGEMRDRVRSLVGDIVHGLWIGTFHSMCVKILRMEGRRTGISPDFTIYDEQDQALLIKQVLADLEISQSKLTPAAVLSKISWAKASLLDPDTFQEMAGGLYDKKVALVYSAYENALRASNALDFDDLISIPVRIFKSSEEALGRNSRRFRYVLIDEYQDTNRAQYELARLLSSHHRNICAVGDDDQSIYRWRGADVTNILNFERDFPDARVIRLEQCYRSTKTILAASQKVIRCNRKRKEKELWTDNAMGRKIVLAGVPGERDEGTFVADTIDQFGREQGRGYSDFVVLYRTNAQSRSIEDALRRKGIPYVIVGGTKFYARREIKDIIAYLRLIVNPRDSVSLTRVINVPSRGIGEITVSRLKGFAARNGCSLFEALERVSDMDEIHAGTRRKLEAFRDLIGQLKTMAGEQSVGELITSAAEKSGYMEYLGKQATVDAISRSENIKELVAGGYEFVERSEEPTLEKFLEEVSLIMDIDMWDDRKDAVSLMTLHNAKGLEFPVVFIAGVEEGLLPHHTSFEDEEELEEERRLFYVGLTRAKERVLISLASGRRGFHGWVPQVGSRFLDDLPQDLLEVITPVAESLAPEGGGEDWGEEKVIRVGSRIKHREWGLGRVLRCEGYGRNLRLTVDFGGGTIKRVLARYANLELLDEDG